MRRRHTNARPRGRGKAEVGRGRGWGEPMQRVEGRHVVAPSFQSWFVLVSVTACQNQNKICERAWGAPHEHKLQANYFMGSTLGFVKMQCPQLAGAQTQGRCIACSTFQHHPAFLTGQQQVWPLGSAGEGEGLGGVVLRERWNANNGTMANVPHLSLSNTSSISSLFRRRCRRRYST